ncbi:MAG: chorismate synthase [Candidatus Omnitrophota bacterium]
MRILTAGESHGRALVAILEGFPAGLVIEEEKINQELVRRQSGYGRGPRMKLEKDKIEILAGIKRNKTLGSPLALMISNKDYKIDEMSPLVSPRPGHADLVGSLKYGFSDIRDVSERASARETAIRVSVGAICKMFLEKFNIKFSSKVINIGGKKEINQQHKKIDEAFSKKDTLGGVFEVIIKNVPIGLGSHVHYDRRLSGILAKAIVSIPGIKAIEFGLGFAYADKFGSQVHDAIYYSKKQGFYHKTNNAGGIEGGISNGEDIIIRCCMKPISTLGNPLDSVDILTKKPTKAAIERSDICAVEATAVIAEAMASFEITNSFLEKFGGDSLKDIVCNYNCYLKRIQ